jgi:hypothetical protein
MLLHTGALLSFWPDALATVTYLLNHRSCCTHNDLTPYQLLLGVPPDYSHLRVFGCHCYPNTTATTLHKLATHSLPCIFVGYLADSKGYRCYDPESRRVLTSRHVLRRVMFSFQVTQLSTTGKSRRAYGAHWHRSGAHVDVPIPPVPTAGDAPVIIVPVTVGSAPSSPVAAPGDVSGTPSPSPVPNPPQAPRLHPPPHPMVTRSHTGTLWPNLRYACVATTSVPSSVSVCDVSPLSKDGQS